MPEPATNETPRDILERAEILPEPTHEELAFALGRLLAWMLEGQQLTKIGQRVLICASKLRPDLIGGATLDSIARRRGCGRSQANRISRQFTRTFGIRGINDRAGESTSPLLRASYFRARGQAKPSTTETGHLGLVNKFCEWRSRVEGLNDGTMASNLEKQRLRRDFEPIARFLAELDEA